MPLGPTNRNVLASRPRAKARRNRSTTSSCPTMPCQAHTAFTTSELALRLTSTRCDAANLRLHLFDRPSRIDSPNAIRPPRRFGQKTVAQPAAKFLALRFHAIGRAADAIGRGLRIDVQQKRQIRLDASGGDFADSPQFVDIQSAGVSLVDHIRQQKSVGNDRLSRGERRAESLARPIAPGRPCRAAFRCGDGFPDRGDSAADSRTASPSGVLPGSRQATTCSPRSRANRKTASIASICRRRRCRRRCRT